MIVVDTNVISYLWLPGDFTAASEKVLRYDPNWVAPLLWRSEFRNVLSNYIRKNIITLEDSIYILNEAERQFEGSEFIVKNNDVMELITQSNCSAYDCEFVALAKDLKIKLVTSDKKIIKEFPKISIPLNSFSETP